MESAIEDGEKSRKSEQLSKIEARSSTGDEADTAEPGHRNTPGFVDRDPVRPGRQLTVWQKRIFVLGLGAREKK